MGKAGKKKAEAKGGFFDAPWTNVFFLLADAAEDIFWCWIFLGGWHSP
jgi:hypothetical protein